MDNSELIGNIVRLVPLKIGDISDLEAIGKDERIWKFLVEHPVSTEEFVNYVHQCIEEYYDGLGLSYVIRRRQDDLAVGVIRLFEYSRLHDKASFITWVTPSVWRTGINTESKFLLLTHAFENLNLIRVNFKVDFRNVRSQRAINRIGATLEGKLRMNTKISIDNRRDDFIYSIIAPEWPTVKERIINLLDLYRS
ncbi:N-acetyltransferase [Capsulimonas corticalis]|uniref:N-acetyltransferase n=1 Tax=Capsulimonas corticalis TaxID=2219043 RepID=A0A402D519_9BACT|nr:GNAT family protein [Capsulimonas corticalis]BDI32599.1 N-acetyltransferase [Capsulimonas corticalis]